MTFNNHQEAEENGHNHTDVKNISSTRLFWVIVLNFGITLAQILGGIISGSLSLISDALHNFTDAISIIISYIAIKLSSKETSLIHTFGLKRAEILAAFINSAVLVGISCYLFVETVKKFISPTHITGSLMLIVAIIGLTGNLISIFLLESHSKQNINIKSAYLHMLADAITSVAVIAGAIGIIFFKIYWIDPLLTILIGLYVLKESYSILKKSTHILMQGTPAEISPEDIKTNIEKLDNVKNVHHIHMWALNEDDIFLEAHVELSDVMLSETCKIKDKIDEIVKEYKIMHTTVQFETDVCCNKNILN